MILLYIAELTGIELRKAFDIYYSSRLARQINKGEYGIENMDAKYLTEDLTENESSLFHSSPVNYFGTGGVSK